MSVKDGEGIDTAVLVLAPPVTMTSSLSGVIETPCAIAAPESLVTATTTVISSPVFTGLGKAVITVVRKVSFCTIRPFCACGADIAAPLFASVPVTVVLKFTLLVPTAWYTHVNSFMDAAGILSTAGDGPETLITE